MHIGTETFAFMLENDSCFLEWNDRMMGMGMMARRHLHSFETHDLIECLEKCLNLKGNIQGVRLEI